VSAAAPPPVAEPTQAPAPTPAPAPAPPPPATMVVINPADVNRKPRLTEPTCIQDNLRLPRDASTEGETIKVRFSVGVDGVPTDLAFLNTPSDSRIDRAIRTAIERCRFKPGTDGKGTPSVQPVVMPFRFGGG